MAGRVPFRNGQEGLIMEERVVSKGAAEQGGAIDAQDRRVESVWWTLRVVFGVVPIVAGLDKFVGLLADWEAYLSPLARELLPVSPAAFMQVVGVVEIAAGILVLARPRVGSFVVAAWLAGIALNLVAGGRYLDVAVRDLVMAVTALCLARLSSVRARVRVPERKSADVRPVGAPGATISARA
jgi:uncharacterized membrane protein YphA (DoxX/SURF4 family)